MNADYISSVFLSIFLRSTLVLAIVGLALIVVRRSSASVRHGVLLVGLASLFVLPIMPIAGPHLSIPNVVSQPTVLRSTLQYVPVSTPVSTAALPAPVMQPAGIFSSKQNSDRTHELVGRQSGQETVAAMPSSEGYHFGWKSWILAVWLAGFCALILRLLTSHIAAWRVARRSSIEFNTPAAGDLPENVGRERFVVSDLVAMPMTWGIAPPIILLPADCKDWTNERMMAVLLHERAHIGRLDWLIQLISEVVRAAYWPHPLVWLLVRRLRLEAEMACDDVVLKSGLSPSTYASELVECVRQSRNKAVALATVAMADRNSVTVRVHAVLETGRNRSQIRRIVAVTAGLVGLIVTVVVGATWTGKAAQGSDTNFFDKQPVQMTCTLIYPDGKPATDATLFVNYSKSGTQEPSSHSYKPDPNGTVKFTVKGDPSLFTTRTIFATSPTGFALWFPPTFDKLSTCVLQPFTSVRVHLIDTGGKPIAGMRISPGNFTYADSNSGWSGDIPGKWTRTTDEAGVATIPDLPQGYKVTFEVLDDRYYSPDFSSAIQMATSKITPDATITAGPAGAITGTIVYSPTAAPVRGVPVMASSDDGFGHAITDDHGGFTISRLKPGLYTIIGDSSIGDFKNWTGQPQQVNVVPGARTSIPAISLIHGGLISGNVLDTITGMPVPNIRVGVIPDHRVGNIALANSTVVTGADGAYSVRTVPGDVEVFAFSPTTQDDSRTSAHLSIAEGETKTINLSLHAPVQPTPVHGVVVGPDGNPVRGAVITIFQSHTSGTVVSDSRGAFVIDSPGLVPKATLRAKAGDLAMTDPLTYSSGSRIVLRLALHTLGSLTGQIKDEDGKPVPGAHASISALGVWIVKDCDPLGNFEFPNVYGNTSYVIGADAPGYRSASAQQIRVADGQTVSVPTLVLTKTDSFAAGTVVDAEGKPIPNAVVTSSDSGQSTSNSATTDAAGRFSLHGVGRGNASVWVKSPSGASSYFRLDSGKTDNVITLPDVVYGIAVGPNGKPVPGAQIIITPQDWEGGNLITSDQEGRFTLDSPGLMPKETVIARSKLFSTAQPVSYNGGNQMVLHLTPGNLCTVKGEILDGNGKPVVGASVTLWLDSNSGYPIDSTKSNAHGDYTFRSAFGNSTYDITTGVEGYSRGQSPKVSVGTGQTVSVPPMTLLISDSFVGGQVVDASEHPVANATVMDRDVPGIQTVTDVQGRFILHGVPRGNTNVQVQSGIHFRQAKLISGQRDNVFHM